MLIADDLSTMQRLERYLTARIMAHFGGQILTDAVRAALTREMQTVWAELQLSDCNVFAGTDNSIVYEWPYGLPSNDVINRYLDAKGAP